MLNIYDLPISAGKTVKIDMSSNPRRGQASLCLKSNACDLADSGEVVFVAYKEGTNATGRYDLHFHNGERVTGIVQRKVVRVPGVLRIARAGLTISSITR